MRSGAKAVVYVTAGLGFGLAAFAANNNGAGDTDPGPYHAILVRNIFDLKDPPPPPVDTGPAKPPPNVKLIGLMVISGHPQGVFAVQDPTPGKPPVSYILSADERQDALEVKSISMENKSAQVQIGDELTELKLEEPKTAAAAGPGPAPGPAGGFVPRPGGFVGPRGGMRGAFTPPGPASYAPQGASYTPNPSAPGYNPDASGGGLPTRPVRTDTGSDQEMTAEQQIVAIEQNREQMLNTGNPLAQILPPTPLTQSLMDSRNQANQPAGDNTPAPTPTTTQLPAYLQQKIHGNYVMPPMPGGQ